MKKTNFFFGCLVTFFLGITNVISAPPAVHNDFWQQAIPLNPIPATATQDTTEATLGENPNNGKAEPQPVSNCGISGNNQLQTVWYKFTASSSAEVNINTFGTSYDTLLSVFTRRGNNFTEIDCNDDFSGLQSSVTIDVDRGKTYYIQIGDWGVFLGGGELVLNVI